MVPVCFWQRELSFAFFVAPLFLHAALPFWQFPPDDPPASRSIPTSAIRGRKPGCRSVRTPASFPRHRSFPPSSLPSTVRVSRMGWPLRPLLAVLVVLHSSHVVIAQSSIPRQTSSVETWQQPVSGDGWNSFGHAQRTAATDTSLPDVAPVSGRLMPSVRSTLSEHGATRLPRNRPRSARRSSPVARSRLPAKSFRHSIPSTTRRTKPPLRLCRRSRRRTPDSDLLTTAGWA